MNPDRWQRLEDLFHTALEMPVAERDAFLISACGDDKQLRADVEKLLHADEQASAFVDSAAAVLTAMRRDPAERYASVALLADDVRRYADGRPDVTRGDSWTYRTARFIRRRKLARRTKSPRLAAAGEGPGG